MAIGETERNELHNRLAEALGAAPAGTLMSYLPPVGWADVATKQDLATLEGRLESRLEVGVAGLRTDMAALAATFHEKLADQTRSLFVGLSGLLAAYSLLIVALVR